MALSAKAFAVMAMCGKHKKHFGISVDPRGGNQFAFCWAFKMNPDQGKREGYDKQNVKGGIIFDPEYNGCPYCGEKNFYLCGNCGKIVCYHGQREVVCPNCGNAGIVETAESFNLSGGGI